jgi:molybdate transport system ATP-binding protein
MIELMTFKPRRHERYLNVELQRVHLRRGRRHVLRGIDWRIAPGQRWVLLGDNGAGKTQLMKLVAGDVWPEPRAGTSRRYHAHGEASDEPYLAKDDIAYLGAERQDRYERHDWNFRAATVVGTGLHRTDTPRGPLDAQQRARAARLLRRFGIEALGNRRLLSLSQGERRLVLLARALAWRPSLLLLDEPLNGLDAPHRARVLAAIESLRSSRLPWVYATQHLEEAPASATHWARLEGGRLVPLRRRRPPRRVPAARRSAAPARTAPRPSEFELHEASVWRGGRAVLRRLSLRIGSGERWLVHGPNGSGKSTFLRTLFGVHTVADRGTIRRRGQRPGSMLADFQRRVGVVSPELQAALPRSLTVLDCIVAAGRGALVLVGAATTRERQRARRALGRVGASGLARRRIGELSYGQARRVLFARALALDPDILLLDEPYTALDERTRTRLRQCVDAAARRGCTIVTAAHRRSDWPPHPTHELELAAGVARYSGPLRGPPRTRARSGS